MFFKKALLAVTLVTTLTACNSPDVTVDYTLKSPDINHVEFDAKLRNKYGIGIGGSFDVNSYAQIVIIPETATSGFGLGLSVNASTFVRETFGAEYSEVTTLPTGLAIPEWMPGPQMDVTIPKYDSSDIRWHFYFGVRGQRTVGVAALLKALGSDVPSVNIGYVFYNKQGKVVLGVEFFGPKVVNGSLVENGGLLIGTNLSPLLPGGNVQALSAEGVKAVSDAMNGNKIQIGGETLKANITVRGSEAHKLNNKRAFKRVMGKFIRATQQ